MKPNSSTQVVGTLVDAPPIQTISIEALVLLIVGLHE
jgi:hypothetical protein